MTFEVYDDLRPGTFKGVKFLMVDDDTTKGNAVADYEFINTRRRVSKFLGGIPPIFKTKIFTHGIGADYMENRDALDDALSSGSSGPLVHPFWGGPFNVRVGPYNVRQSMKRVGYCEFDVEFKVCDKDDGNPLVDPSRLSNPSQNRSLANAALASLQTACGDAMENNSPLNYDSSKGLIESMSDGFAGKLSGLGDTIQKVSDYTGKALEMREKAAFYADNPLLLFAAAADLLLGVDGLTLDVFAKFTAVKALFNWGDSDSDFSVQDASPVRIDPDPQTNEDAERETNSQVMTTFMQAGATIEAYAQAGATDYNTIDEINEAQQALDSQFDIIADSMTKNEEAEIYDFNVPTPDYSETNDAIRELRTSVRQYFDQQRLETARVETITIAPTPASVLSYQLYGDSTRAEELMDLNGIRDNMALSGEIRFLSK